MKWTDFASEIILRCFLGIFLLITEFLPPFHRVIQPEELWLYRYPTSKSYYSGSLMWATVLLMPIITFLGFFSVRRDKQDLVQASFGAYLAIFLTGALTNCLKVVVGRPRPDFLARCYPDGLPENIKEIICTGPENIVSEGLKSFPSGHSSLSFCCMTFIAMYIGGKLHVFSRGRGQGWRFICFLIPLVWATMISVSRVSDYHHHWQDVTVGSIVGIVIGYTCYRQVFPSLSRMNSHLAYSQKN
ncbi:phospholipid phosphatase 5-like isoform X2 [Pomacea canaliculata]|uniref:phospholipid phosphatase 5-like isoform X2 n=1 Tax=Pomacea canaliculata TaxID=400727 RepID=UPI000D728FDE|nr:phospholipid phosphatase 5-like isoform X2 [Pomacea canaliculata]